VGLSHPQDAECSIIPELIRLNVLDGKNNDPNFAGVIFEEASGHGSSSSFGFV